MVDISSSRLNDFHHDAFPAMMQSKNGYDNMVVQVEERFARLKRCIQLKLTPDKDFNRLRCAEVRKNQQNNCKSAPWAHPVFDV
jgi:hypothetical protein